MVDSPLKQLTGLQAFVEGSVPDDLEVGGGEGRSRVEILA
jgi:hypothetical protein